MARVTLVYALNMVLAEIMLRLIGDEITAVSLSRIFRSLPGEE